MPRFELAEESIGDSDSDRDSNSDSNSDSEAEPAHPLGFGGALDPSSPWGKTWISLDPPPRSQYLLYSKGRGGRSKYFLDDEEDLFVQSYPPISTYLSSEHVPTTALLRFGTEGATPQQLRLQPYLNRRDTIGYDADADDLYYSSADDDEDEEEKEIINAFYDDPQLESHGADENETAENSDVVLLLQHTYRQQQQQQQQHTPSSPALLKLQQGLSFASPKEIRAKRDETDRRIQRRVEAERRRIDEEYNRTTAILGELILRSNKEAESILQKRKAEEDRLAKAQTAREERERKVHEKTEQEAALRKQKADREASEQQQAAHKQSEERKAKDAATEQKRQEIAAKKKKKTEHIDKAKKLVLQLVQVRASVEPFEKNKVVGKRRLGMKKIAKGKVNTLNDNPGKITEVATEISQAIARYDQEDAQIKQQLQQKTPGMTPDMAVGRRYFVDLLASTAMTRVQAESFSGTKGDGFPLATMLAMVSVQNKNLANVLAAHVYTVCPTAIPTLPTPKADASEDDVMTGLGMQRNKKTGDFESFPQFLARTENIVAFMAAIQSSLPSSHQLLSGNTGALFWLKRFLDLLPPAPTAPLPLTTAPVLGAFLTNAGHMLANVHTDNFRKLLGKIESDIVHRLDEGEIGKPSAIRLNKVLEGGFESFRKNLPSKAVPDLYCGASENSQKNEAAVTSFSGTIGGKEDVQPKRDRAPPPSQRYPQQHQNQQRQNQQQVPNPFGGGGSGGGGFGGSNNNNSNSGNNNNNNSSQSPFANVPHQSPFGGSSSPATFGGAPNPSSFGGGGQAPSASPFGGANDSMQQQPQQSPFGGASGMVPTPSPFGGTSGMAQSQSPFGRTTAPSPSPFGGGATSSQSPFGGGAAPSPSPFGGGAASSQSPFGGGAAPSQSPFGGGAAPSPSPFGGAAAPSPSPFGATGNTGNPSPFRGNNSIASNPSPFGGGSNTIQQNTPYGGGRDNNQQNAPFGGNERTKAPCKFFQQGKCRKGDNCQYSHETGSGGGGGFGNQVFQSNNNAAFGSNNNNNNNGGGRNNFGSNNSGGTNNGGFGSNNNNTSKRGPCRFFAQGRCKKGNNCPFSHDVGNNNSSSSRNNSNNNQGWNSFGGPRR
jgi:hypothetical protein